MDQELYIKEIQSRVKAITWMTFGQLVVTFTLSTSIVIYISNLIPLTASLPLTQKKTQKKSKKSPIKI